MAWTLAGTESPFWFSSDSSHQTSPEGPLRLRRQGRGGPLLGWERSRRAQAARPPVSVLRASSPSAGHELPSHRPLQSPAPRAPLEPGSQRCASQAVVPDASGYSCCVLVHKYLFFCPPKSLLPPVSPGLRLLSPAWPRSVFATLPTVWTRSSFSRLSFSISFLLLLVSFLLFPFAISIAFPLLLVFCFYSISLHQCSHLQQHNVLSGVP